MSFFDAPADPCLPGGNAGVVAQYCGGVSAPAGSILAFTTCLVGIMANNAVVDTGVCFNWTDTFNGTNGGIAVTNTNQPVDAGSGTGAITLTSYNGTPAEVTYPTLLQSNQVSVTLSGTSWDSPLGAFVETVTITNASDNTITGPFEVGLESLGPRAETLFNATGTFGGWSYITFSGVSSLDAGQSAVVTLDLSDPSVLIPGIGITFIPNIYSGTIE